MSKKALIIDDDANSGGVLEELLTMQGFAHRTIRNPAQIAAALKADPAIDVIFLDLEMPGMNGYQVFEMLKGDPRMEEVPIVACTVHVSEINVAREMGFHSFIGKPVDLDQFPDQLTRILEGKGVWAVM
jgi:CheY-like chemotaxis protein